MQINVSNCRFAQNEMKIVKFMLQNELRLLKKSDICDQKWDLT